MHHNGVQYWQTISLLPDGHADRPSPRVCRLLLRLFDTWKTKPLWLEEKDTGHLFDGKSDDEIERLSSLPMAVRKGMAIARMLDVVTLRALTAKGRLFINIQTNPLPLTTIESGEHPLTFEMTRCNYFLELGHVEKTFRLTYRGHTYHVNDRRFCETYAEFANQVSQLGFMASVSEDRHWIIVNRAG